MRKEIITAARIKMRLDPEDSLRLAKNKIYERAETELIAAEVSSRPWRAFIDVGAHIGYHSLLAWQAQRRSGIREPGGVFAFEPNALNFEILKENIFINLAEEIGAVDMAITDKTGEGTLYLSPKNSGDHRAFPSPGPSRSPQPIKTSRLDDIEFIPRGRIGLIKIDTQGGESKVLAGGARTLAEPGIKMLIEFYPAGLSAAGSSGQALLEAIAEAGFGIQEIEKATGRRNPVGKRSFTALTEKYGPRTGRHCNLICERQP